MHDNLPLPWRELQEGCTVDGEESAAWNAGLDRLELSVRRTREECWIDYRYVGQPGAGNETQSLRYLLNDGDAPMSIAPQLADRPIVARPMMPTELLPKERATLYIGTAVWARVSVGDQMLAEFPTQRMSDTWFGANTLRGELCYASQTRALVRHENVPYSVCRAIVPVTIDNQGEDNVKLERLNVPVPHLTLYCDGRLFWTSALTILREKNLDTAKLRIDPTPPPNASVVASPRRPIRGGVFDRAVDLLFA